MNIVFMGTPDFALPALKALYESDHHISLVVTQPDKAIGRGKKIQFSPIKEYALEKGLEIAQPQRIRNDVALIERLKKLQPDVIVVVAFGQILTQEILDIPKYGCFNIHASILPAYRGAAPIQWAIYDGQKETGVTIMKMDAGLDTGDMLLIERLPIEENETGASLFEKLSILGGELILRVLEDVDSYLEKRQPQPKESTTDYAKMLTKQSGEISWKKSAIEIERQIRAFNPWPGSFTYLDRKLFKIFEAKVVEGRDGVACGEVIKVSPKELVIQTKEGSLSILEVQLEGKKRMKIADFLRGYNIEVGKVL